MAASDPRQSPGFRRRLLAARLFVWAERVWPAVWPAVGVAGLFLATSLLGLWYGLTTVPQRSCSLCSRPASRRHSGAPGRPSGSATARAASPASSATAG